MPASSTSRDLDTGCCAGGRDPDAAGTGADGSTLCEPRTHSINDPAGARSSGFSSRIELADTQHDGRVPDFRRECEIA
jgi:hypothetical protein